MKTCQPNKHLLSFKTPSELSFDQLQSREWLEVFANGGYASSTLSGAHSRGYHGILVAADPLSLERIVLLSRFDELLISTSTQRFDLATRQYRGVVTPDGYTSLKTVDLSGPAPTWVFTCGEALLERSLIAIPGRTGVIFRYVLHSTSPATLLLTPYFAFRSYHTRQSQISGLTVSRLHPNTETTIFIPNNTLPGVKLIIANSHWHEDHHWYQDFFYSQEHARGLPSTEDLLTPGFFEVKIEPGQPLFVGVFSANDSPYDELSREFSKASNAKVPLVVSESREDFIASLLKRAAKQFVIRNRSMIAGYHWFTDWGRDTMIALPGILLVDGEFEPAKAIFDGYLAALDGGLIPNRFPDGISPPEYNAVDATLWFIIAGFHFAQKSRDRNYVNQVLLPACIKIIDHFDRGTRYGIKVQPDGLLAAGEPGVQLTWMDAKIGTRVITPRSGLPVEVNALWINALEITASFLNDDLQLAKAEYFGGRASAARQRFVEIFINPKTSTLYDCISEFGPDDTIRPNQLFAISLPFPVVGLEIAEAILLEVEQHLLTPCGLRTLSPSDPRFRGHYGGSPEVRDESYHQGTVWPWLFGPYITALIRFRGERGCKQARGILEQFFSHLGDGGVGSISEIFDGLPPYNHNGCIAQAWSVGEIRRVYCELRLLEAGQGGAGLPG